jgi:hypothetical protein
MGLLMTNEFIPCAYYRSDGEMPTSVYTDEHLPVRNPHVFGDD